MYRDRGTDEDADMIEERRCKFGPKTSVSRPVYWISSLESQLFLARIVVHTFQGLLTSNPFGAWWLLDCPLSEPVMRRSRSITAFAMYG